MALDLARIRALCFDVDGTLSDTDDQFVCTLAGWFHALRFAFPKRDPLPFARRAVMFTETPGSFLFGIPDRLGVDGWIARLGDAVYHRLGVGGHIRPFLLISGVDAALARLEAVYPLAVVSARGQRSAEALLDQFHLKPHFRCIATAQTCRHTKPYPDPILWSAAQMGVPPRACLMIGDTRVDIQAGKAAGAQTVGVLSGFGERQELERAGADLILNSATELPRAMGLAEN